MLKMERIASGVSVFCAPYIAHVSAVCGKRAKCSILPVGIVLAYFLVKKTGSINRRRQTDIKIKRKQAQLEESKRSFENRYPNVTERQGEIVALDFDDLRRQLQSGDLSALEVVEAFIAKAIEVNRSCNAVVEFLDEAITRARGLDSLPSAARGPLHGVPISLKEHVWVDGRDCTVGIASKIGVLAEKDAELVRLLKHLGAVPFCRTNLPQTCISFDCSNPIFGVTTNFKDPERSPGGSSGGEGALIAGGGSVMGIGSDLGGSVRIPAAFSGITALKPTSGRLPLSGQGSDGGLVGVAGVFNTLGFMARSAKGINACMREILGEKSVAHVTLDPRFVPLPWSDKKGEAGRKLRIGWYDYDGCFQVTPGCQRAVAKAVEILETQGHELVQFCPPDLDKVTALFGKLSFADGGKNTAALLADGPVDQQSMGYKFWEMTTPMRLKKFLSHFVAFKSAILAGGMTIEAESGLSSKLWELNAYRLKLVENILTSWDENNIDVIICPGMAMPAQPLGYPQFQQGSLSYTAVWNVANFPSGSIPISQESAADQRALEDYPGYEKDLLYGWIKDGTRGANGMSLNVQVVGRPWTEELVLRVMMELENNVSLN